MTTTAEKKPAKGLEGVIGAESRHWIMTFSHYVECAKRLTV